MKGYAVHVVLLSLILLSACNFFRAPGRDDCDKILSGDQMADILTEIYILETFINEYQHIERKIRDSAKYYYAGVFDYHGVDPSDFDEALDCYLVDTREMDRIHEKILSRLSVMESEADEMPAYTPPDGRSLQVPE